MFADHSRPVYALSFSPDGHWLSTGSGDGWFYVYDVLVSRDRFVSTCSICVNSLNRRGRRNGRGLLVQKSLECLRSTGRYTKG